MESGYMESGSICNFGAFLVKKWIFPIKSHYKPRNSKFFRKIITWLVTYGDFNIFGL